MMKLLGNRLLVKEVLPGEKTDGGIVIPEQARAAGKFGPSKLWDVIAVGPGRLSLHSHRYPVQASPGDRVITFSYSSGAFPLEDGTAIIDESLILAIIPKDKRYERVAE